ncbi:hypothetical protein QJQ45_030092 [Haematococcus lacustris]|nr:hypothetical protein QJQ45_030092 [Haematococcus lacustris]
MDGVHKVKAWFVVTCVQASSTDAMSTTCFVQGFETSVASQLQCPPSLEHPASGITNVTSDAGSRPSVVQVVAAHPSVVKGGGLTLECDDGRLPVSRDVFALSSPLCRDPVCRDTTQCTIQRTQSHPVCPMWSLQVSGSSKEEWLLVISQLYPIVPRPELSLQQLQQVLPVVHKARDVHHSSAPVSTCVAFHEQSLPCLLHCLQYNFSELLQYVCSRLATELPSSWSLDPAAPGYITKWLVTAEQLQLDALKEAALEGLKKQPDQRLKRQLATKAMHADLLRLSPELMLEAWRVVAEAKICSACAQDCTCEEKRRYAAYCHKCGERSRCDYCGQYYWR